MPAAAQLPLWWSREFLGQPRLVGEARSWMARLLPACEPLDDMLMFASELGANAVTHTRSGQPGGRFTVEVIWSPQAARVVVGDQGSDEVPAAAKNSDDLSAGLEGGRGLLLVDAMSATWGIVGNEGGRWLWADVLWRSRGGPLSATFIGSNDAEAQFVAMRCAYPGTLAWYGEQSGQWHARLPTARDALDTLTAPSPTALSHMVAARYPPTRIGIS